MARPRKNPSSSHEENLNSEENETMTELAFGIYKDPETGEWNVSELRYNPLTGNGKLVKSIPTDAGLSTAVEKFKIVVARSGLLDERN